MLSGITSLSISSGLWFTAMAANPIGAEMVRARGVDIAFGSWLATSIVPTLVALVAMPWVVYRLQRPEVQRTPDAPARARARSSPRWVRCRATSGSSRRSSA